MGVTLKADFTRFRKMSSCPARSALGHTSFPFTHTLSTSSTGGSSPGFVPLYPAARTVRMK
ncbi:hypothetical protein EES39_40930 [Streptomyces sp. ADI92-24]|nr:hypothetical protein EES39_40930 [Streptomyces sp. ADI92-24]